MSLIALERALGSSVTIPLEMLHAARTISRVKPGNDFNLTLDIVGLDRNPVTMAGGLVVTPTADIAQIHHTDLIIIPGLWGSPLKTLRKCATMLQWLTDCHYNGSILFSIVTGSYFLAQAGLLNHRTATTHWYFFEDFRRRYPLVKLDQKRFITHDNNLYCTGSVNAARDVLLHLVEQLFDEGIAREVAKHFTHEIKRSYESMLLGLSQPDSHHDEQIIKVQEWLQTNFQREIRFDVVADKFQMSVRSFNRRFKNAARMTPQMYVQQTRIAHAKELLKHSNLAIAEVSYAVGYHDTSYFGSLFKRAASITPAEYRRLVRSKLFKVED